MDNKNVIFPMTVGDLVQSAGVVLWHDRGGGPEIIIRRVSDVQVVDDNLKNRVVVTFDDDPYSKIELYKDTTILVTEISRW